MLYFICRKDKTGKFSYFCKRACTTNVFHECSFLNVLYKNMGYVSHDRAKARLEKLKAAFPNHSFEIIGLDESLFIGNRFIFNKKLYKGR